MTTLAVTASLFFVGCASAPQAPVPLAAATVNGGSRIGVAMTAPPQADTYFPGAGCLLCLAAASVANSSLTSHTKTLPQDDLLVMKTQIADALRKKGSVVVLIDEALRLKDLPDASAKGPNLAAKDFASLKTKYQIDRLVVIDVMAVGVERNYASYIPTSDPKSFLRGVGYLVNLTNNTYEWYLPVNVLKATEGNWDEPPKFPGLTNAYFQALEIGKDSFVKPFTE